MDFSGCVNPRTSAWIVPPSRCSCNLHIYIHTSTQCYGCAGSKLVTHSRSRGSSRSMWRSLALTRVRSIQAEDGAVYRQLFIFCSSIETHATIQIPAQENCILDLHRQNFHVGEIPSYERVLPSARCTMVSYSRLRRSHDLRRRRKGLHAPRPANQRSRDAFLQQALPATMCLQNLWST